MVRDLGSLEDKGWIRTPVRAPIQALAAELKTRTAVTLFVVHSADSADSAGCTSAGCLAKEGSKKASLDNIDLGIQPEMQLKGVKLSSVDSGRCVRRDKRDEDEGVVSRDGESD
ncbi:hypothetical protein DFH09DRAFT_1102349 [Mycena vulgaris]|nr:hypothetical protein DFH09DRAFT_1102349 [Mycena vulgaris]